MGVRPGVFTAPACQDGGGAQRGRRPRASPPERRGRGVGPRIRSGCCLDVFL